MSIKDLCDAVIDNDIGEINRLIAAGIDPNDVHPWHHMRPIDFAAMKGDLETIKFLIETHRVTLALNPKYPTTNLLYYTLQCHQVEKQKDILQWLLENERYNELQCNVSKAHILSALGKFEDIEPNDMEANIDNLGLAPWHYAFVSNQVSPDKILANASLCHLWGTNAGAITKGILEKANIPWLLVYADEYSRLKSFVAGGLPIGNLNASVIHEAEAGKGATVAWFLAKEEYAFLTTLTQNNQCEINLNSKPELERNPDYNRTTASLLTEHEQYDLFVRLSQRSPQMIIDVTANVLLDKKTISLGEKLIHANRLDILDDLMQRYVENENDLELQNWIDKHVSAEYKNIFLNSLFYAQITKYRRAIFIPAAPDETIPQPQFAIDTCKKIAKLIEQINKTTVYYAKAQKEKADLLQQLAAHPNFCSKLLKEVSELFTNSTQLTSQWFDLTRLEPTFRVKYEMFIAYKLAGDFGSSEFNTFLANFMLDICEIQQQLQAKKSNESTMNTILSDFAKNGRSIYFPSADKQTRPQPINNIGIPSAIKTCRNKKQCLL